MPELSAITDIEDVVKMALWQSKKDSADRMRFLEFAIWGYREICVNHVADGVRMLKVTPDSNNIVHMPESMEMFVAIGEVNNGRFTPYSPDSDIITTTTGGSSETMDAEWGEGVDVSNPPSEGLQARAYNPYGKYTIDYNKRRILLNSTVRKKLILLYKSSNVKLNEATYVPKKYVQAIIAWILWKDIEGNDNKIGLSERREMAFNRRMDEVRTRAINIEELADDIMSTYTMLPKR